MNAAFLKKALPHILIILLFLVVAMLYCKPALEGRVLNQSDVIGHTAMARQSEEFKAKYGHFPFWTESMFSGMPAYNIALYSSSTILNYIGYYLLTFGFSPFNPISLFFIACICFYILTQVLRINPWVGAISALAYAYSTFDPIIVAVGHNTQMAAIGYAPAVIAGLLLIYQRKWLYGAALLCVFFGLQLGITQHLQVVYYTIMVLGLVTLAFLVKSWKEKTFRQAWVSIGVALASGIIALGTNAVALLPVQEYSKETMRGGKSELSGNNKTKTKGGLDKDYAFTWSYGIPESFTFIIPGAYGGGTGGKNLSEDSKFANKLEEIGYAEANAISAANYYSYWGDQGGDLRTSGPVYFGAAICFLFIFGLVYTKGWNKWWIVAATITGIVLAWGKNFSGINYFLFDHLPFYSKFRSPTMALIIPQLTVPLLAALGLDQVLRNQDNKEFVWKKFKSAAMITGAILLLGFIFYLMTDFKGPHDAGMRENISSGALQQLSRGKQPTPEIQQQANELGNSVLKSLQSDRQSLFASDLLRSLIFIALAAAALGLYLKSKINTVIFLAGLLILCSYDLLAEGKKYLSEDNFVEPVDIENSFVATPADKQILADPDKHFRVFDESDQGNGPFNSARASYFHNSVGGYHPAKLGLYQDIIENQLSKGNMTVFNMLNTRYFIQANPKTGQPLASLNPAAFGPCWLVKAIHFVNNSDEEMKALDSINTKDTAIVQKSFESKIKFMPVPDSSATIRLLENLNDKLSYQFSSKTNQFAVFSEVYYNKGWNVYLDGNSADYCKVDYVLRGMPIPAGDHRIEFRFEPRTFYLGEKISWVASIIAYLLLFAAIWQMLTEWNKKQKTV